MRLDAGLARLLGLSRSAVAELAAAGEVGVDGVPAGKSDRLIAGALLDVRLPASEPAAPVPVEGMTVLGEDDDIIVLDKPAGVAVHPSPGWSGPTVLGGLTAAGTSVAAAGAEERRGVVHRLDATTTGALVVAKSEHAYSSLKRAFKERTVRKIYHATVQGHPDPSTGTIDAPIGRHPGREHRFAVVTGGKPSVTHYELLEAFRAASLLEIHLETGRTHQIRVHAAATGHPCLGDTAYGADPALARRFGLARQWLHARSLGFAHPATGEWVEFASDYPADLAAALRRLRRET
jgi:23S rRNA pseudouridine1911/1915/1917 synthase